MQNVNKVASRPGSRETGWSRSRERRLRAPVPALTGCRAASLGVGAGALALLCVALCPAGARADAAIQAALAKATRYLEAHQNPDGGFGPTEGDGARIPGTSDVGLTSIVVYGIARQRPAGEELDLPFLDRAVHFVLSRQQSDGAIYDPRDPVLRNYRTCVAIMALSALDPERYERPIERARKFVEDQQYDEEAGFQADESLAYGGFSYGDGGDRVRFDLSNSGLAADALHASGVSGSAPLWRRLAVFVSRCQNTPEVDPLVRREKVGTTGDWGFRYTPVDTRGPSETIDGNRVFSSYGSMTYQGLKTLLYAGVSRDDPRVKNAFDWIAKNFTVRENPGMATAADPEAGQQGYYYYVHTMAKALAAFGKPVIVDAKGREHSWARELSRELIDRQKEDGHWVNDKDRWWEGLPALPTAFAMVALAQCQEALASPEGGAETKPSDEKGASPAEPNGSRSSSKKSA